MAGFVPNLFETNMHVTRFAPRGCGPSTWSATLAPQRVLAWNTTHPLQRAKTAIAHGDPFNPTASLWSYVVAERQMENTSVFRDGVREKPISYLSMFRNKFSLQIATILT